MKGRLKQIHPVLPVRNVSESISYYTDKLAFTFDSNRLPFLNIMMDIAAVDLARANDPNGRYGVNTPIFRFSVFDSSNGNFNINAPGQLLDRVEVTGNELGSTPFTFNWASVMGILDISNASSNSVSIIIELLQSGYGSFDNIIASFE